MSDESTSRDASANKLPPSAHALCGWPLVLVLFGGAIGGGFGALAYFINLRIYKSQLPSAAKIVLNPLIGLAAFALWFVIGVAIQVARQK
jgi:hypothetical protein